jgi:hypothetical protein
VSEGGNQVEPVTGAIVTAGKVAKAVDESKLLERLVGPMFEAMGLAWAEGYRRRNAEKIARKAARKADPEQMALPAAVHPRVAHRVLDDGSFIDEDVMQEYLAGLLAGARTDAGDDDRAAYYVDIVASLPSAQVRLHHAIYSAVASAGPQKFGRAQVLRDHSVVTPVESAFDVVGMTDAVFNPHAALAEALLGLRREGLIERYAVHTAADLDIASDAADQRVMVAMPSTLGCILALWAHAIPDADIRLLQRILPCDFEPAPPEFSMFSLQNVPRV